VLEFSLRADVAVIKLSMESKLSESFHTCMSLLSMPDVDVTLEKRVTRHRELDCRPSSRKNRFPRVWSEHNLFPPFVLDVTSSSI